MQIKITSKLVVAFILYTAIVVSITCAVTTKILNVEETSSMDTDSIEASSEPTEDVEIVEEVSDVPCDICGRMMVIKYGKFGKFLACPGYPECQNAKPLIETIDVPCPKCGGVVQIRKTKSRRNYYICENNPASCNYISWNKPKLGETFVESDDVDELEKEAKVKKASKAKKTTKRKTSKKTTKKK